MNQILATAVKHWTYVAPIATYPANKKEFEKLTARLDELLEIVGNNENHHLMGLVDVISGLIASYEEDHHLASPSKGLDALKYLMNAHHLRQGDLSEIASQGIMSEILSGRRELNLRQIKQLAKRFHVSPATFIDD